MTKLFNKEEYEEVSVEELKAFHEEIGAELGKTRTIEIYEDWINNNYYVAYKFDLAELGFRDEDYKWFLKKLDFIEKKIEKAYEEKYVIEWMTASIIKLEFLLKQYLLIGGYYDRVSAMNDRQTFGQLIREAIRHGLPKKTSAKLNDINNLRNRYIHGFLDRSFEYESFLKKKHLFDNVKDEVQELVDNNAVILETVEEFEEHVRDAGLQFASIVKRKK